VEIVPREVFQELELDSRVELIRSLIPLGLMQVQELLDEEVRQLAGERYERKDGGARGTRHGSNPGSVLLAGQRLAIRVPRVRGEAGERPLLSYAALHAGGALDEGLLRRVLCGISCRDYEAAAQAVPGAIGLSSSTVSRKFIRASAARLKALQERDLSGEDIVVIFLDGKSFAEDTLVVALGVTLSGEKRFLGFVETGTENEKVLSPFLRSLLERGLDISRGVLVVIDGSKGIRAAVRKAFERNAVVQRCQWHKRENVVKYLPTGEQQSWRRRLQSAYHRPTHQKALTALQSLRKDLAQRNESAAASLDEGLEETLTLHRLGLYTQLGASLKTTNCLESVNAMVEQRCAKVDRWTNSNQRHRWLASTLLDIEPRLRRVKGHRYLPMLREALQRELGLSTGQLREAA
jgi:transposase-like protein